MIPQIRSFFKTRPMVAALAAIALLVVCVGTLHAYVNEAISYALEAATPYVEEGFEVREDNWSGEVAPEKPLLIRHQLFRGNEYWFWAGTSWPGATVKVDIFDAEGNPVSLESFQKDSFAGARALPQKTATYLVRVVVSYDAEVAAKLEAENPGVDGVGAFEGVVDWGLVYGYR